MEVPRGFEPRVEDLQSFALPTWLWNQLSNYTTSKCSKQEKTTLLLLDFFHMIKSVLDFDFFSF